MKRSLSVVAAVVLVLTPARLSSRSQAQQLRADRSKGNVMQPLRGRILVKFQPEITTDHGREIIAALNGRDAGQIPAIGVHIVELPYQASEAAYAQAFGQRPEVEFAEVDRLHRPEQVPLLPNDPLYDNPNSWSLPKINAPTAWALNTGSSNVTVAILDTGVDITHPDLASQIVPGWNVYQNNADVSDVFGHGTAVAGITAAASNNATGITSIAWGCRIMPVRISDTTGMAPDSAIASGLTWAADHGARVANVSYYITGSRTITTAAKYFVSKGGIVTVAAGNYGTTETASDSPYLLTVGASDQNDFLYSWSNRGNNLDLVAPGNVYTTARGGTYGVATGTSFAAPIVAGIAALALSINPSLTPAQVESLLKQNAFDLGPSGWDSTFGYGRVDAASTLVAAAGVVVGSGDKISPSVVITSPGGGTAVFGTVSVQVSATDDTAVTKVSLYVDGNLVASTTATPAILKWNTRKAPAGQHVLSAKAIDAAGNVGVSSEVMVYK